MKPPPYNKALKISKREGCGYIVIWSLHSPQSSRLHYGMGESTKKNLNFEKKNTFQNLKCIFESRNPFIMVNI